MAELATINSHTLPVGYRLFDAYEIRAVLQLGVASVRYAATADDGPVVVEEYFPARLAKRHDGVEVAPESARAADEFEAGLSAFLATSRTLSRLRDDNIATVHRWVDANGTGYAVSEAVQGETLGARLDRHGTLPDDQLMSLVQPLVRGLGVAHGIGMLHRQVNPEAIVVRSDGTPVLCNFGIGTKVVGGARQTFDVRTRNLADIAPGYAALEQYSPGGREGPWTDIYALGAVMYRCVTGTTPADAPFRAAGGDLVPAAHLADGRDAHMLAAIDAAMAVPIASRPQSLPVWQAMLFRDSPQAMLASRAGRTSARGFGHAVTPAPSPISVSRPVTRVAGRQGAEDAAVGGRALRWAVPALAATGMIAVFTWVDIGVLRRSADAPAGVPPEHGSVRRNELADELRSGGTGPTMVMLPPGRIRIGCFGNDCSGPEAPGRAVVIDRAFAVSKYEVTEIDYAPFAAATGRPSPLVVAGGVRRPALNVSWHDAVAYAEWLSEQTGRDYHLPSEAEWEYAARAGDDGAAGNADAAAPSRTATLAGGGAANAWGLHDMRDSVSEWVFDCGGAVRTPAPVDGSAWVQEMCESRVRRGGSSGAPSPDASGAAPRTSSDPSRRAPDTGFRVALRLD